MSFDQDPGHQGGLPRLLPRKALAYIGAGVITLGVSGEAIYSVVNALNSDVKGVGHEIEKGLAGLKPAEAAQIEAQEALDDVSLPTFTPIVSGTVTGSGSLDTFKTFPVFGGRVPGTSDGVDLAQTGTALILARKDATVSDKVYELPGSSTASPKFAATVKVDVDDLYPAMLNSKTPTDKNGHLEVNSHDGFFPKTTYVFFGGAPDSKYTTLMTNVEDNYLAVKCGQAMAPLIQAGFQNDFYEQAGKTPLPPGQSPQVRQYLNQIGNRSLPVTVDLVNGEGQPVNPQTFQLNVAGLLMSNTQIAKQAGVSTGDLDVKMSSPCESKPAAVQQQIAIAENYLSHTGVAASVNVSYGG